MGSPCTFLPFFQWLATAESSPGCLTRGLESAAERLMDFRLIFPCFPGVFLKKIENIQILVECIPFQLWKNF